MFPFFLIVIIVLALALIVIALWVIGIYNTLQRQRIGTEASFSQIDVMLKRRWDLIPNLIETVKGYAAHEKGTLEGTMRARAAAMGARDPAERMKAEGELSGFLSRLMAVAEAYPDLKANTNFMSLQNQLAETEGTIASARTGYNGSASAFNETLSVFPSNLIGGLFGFKPFAFFQTAEAERATPSVKF
ncbi:MAG: LemA family protein [Planctomycetota bacterium]|nr:LemA family protein [Planctomycetota bacterium]